MALNALIRGCVTVLGTHNSNRLGQQRACVVADELERVGLMEQQTSILLRRLADLPALPGV